MSGAGRRRSSGQSLTEFALVFPFFAILLFGIIDMGRYVFTANTLGNAVRDAARVGSVANRPTPTCDGLARDACVELLVDQRAVGVSSLITTTVSCDRIAPNDATPNPVVPAADCRSNDLLTVRSETTFNLVTPIVAQFIGDFLITADSSVSVNN